jgi:hypothetical protein
MSVELGKDVFAEESYAAVSVYWAAVARSADARESPSAESGGRREVPGTLSGPLGFSFCMWLPSLIRGVKREEW